MRHRAIALSSLLCGLVFFELAAIRCDVSVGECVKTGLP